MSATLGLPWAQPAEPRLRTAPLVIAHRGSSAVAPENTLAALRQAVLDGADAVEFDVRRTRDGALVLLHDPTLERTTDIRSHRRAGSTDLAGLTLSQVRCLDAGSWKGPEFRAEPVPTLAAALEFLRPTGLHAVVEVKSPETQPGLAIEVAEEIRRLGLAPSRVTVQSFHLASMRAVRHRFPELRVGVLGGRSARGLSDRLEGLRLAEVADFADQLNPHHRLIDRRLVDRIHDRRLTCLTWTVNSVRSMRRAVRIGVDGIITDRPRALRLLLDS